MNEETMESHSVSPLIAYLPFPHNLPTATYLILYLHLSLSLSINTHPRVYIPAIPHPSFSLIFCFPHKRKIPSHPYIHLILHISPFYFLYWYHLPTSTWHPTTSLYLHLHFLSSLILLLMITRRKVKLRTHSLLPSQCFLPSICRSVPSATGF